MPEILSTRTVYEGKVFDVVVEEIQDGENRYSRELVTHNGSAVVLPVFEDGTIALVRQYRHPANKYLLEIPAGGLEKGEEPEAGAHRELEEEIGVRAGRLEKLSEFYPSPGFMAEKMHLFLATELTTGEQNLDDDEYVEIIRHTFADAFDLVRTGAIEDGKTILALVLAVRHLGLEF